MPLKETIAADAKRMAARGAGRAFEHTVRHIYQTLSGDPPRESPVALVQRLLEDGRVTAEAALYLFTLNRALDHAGAFRIGPLNGVRAVTARLDAVRALVGK